MANFLLNLESKYPHQMGVSYGLVQAFFGAGCGPFMKWLTGFHLFEIFFYQCLIMTILNYFLLKATKVTFNVKNSYILVILMIRIIFGYTNGIVHFYAFQVYRLGDVLCFFQLNSIFVGIFAYLLWKEEFGKKEIICVFLCIIGCILITKPPFLTGETSFYSNTDICILTAIPLLESVIQLAVRKISHHVHMNTIPFYYAVNGVIESQLYIFYTGYTQIPNFTQAKYILGFTLCEFCLLLIKTRSFSLTDSINASIALSSQIVWGYLFDILIFGSTLDLMQIIGALMVIYGSLMNINTKKGQKKLGAEKDESVVEK